MSTLSKHAYKQLSPVHAAFRNASNTLWKAATCVVNKVGVVQISTVKLMWRLMESLANIGPVELRRGLLGLAILLIWLPGLAAAQSETFMATYERYNTIMEQGRYADAVPLARELAALGEQEFGPMHENTAALQYQLALLLQVQNQLEEVEDLLTRVLSIYDSKPDADAAVGLVLSDLAQLYLDQARFVPALEAYKRVLRIRKAELGPYHPDVSATLNDIAEINRETGRFSEAEALYQQSLDIDETHFGPDHPEVATTLNNLALLYESQGRYGEAEPLHRRALAIREAFFGPDSLAVAGSLNNLAGLYQKDGRYDLAEGLLRRAVVISHAAVGEDSRETAIALNNLAVLLGRINRQTEAAELYQQSVETFERLDGPDHPSVATSLIGLAESYRKAGRFAESEPLLRRALEIRRRVFSHWHFETALAMNNLAVLYQDQGRREEAEALFRSLLGIQESTLRPDHPLISTTLTNMASLCDAPACYPEALGYIRRATEIARERIFSGALLRSDGGLSEQRVLRPQLLRHIAIAKKNMKSLPEQRAVLTAESFEVAQLTQTTAAARSVAGMATRFAAGDDALARLVREQQDTLGLWLSMDKRLIELAALPPGERDLQKERSLRENLTDLGLRLEELKQELAQNFPEYAEIASPRPMDLSEAQNLLGPGEALIVYAVSDATTFVYLVRPGRAAFKQVDLDEKDLGKAVAQLRSQLTPVGVYGLADLLDRGYDAEEAYSLYQLLFAPLAPELKDVHHVFVVPDGALQSLPLGVLLTEEPQGALANFADFRNAPWLARQYALTTLPSVSSLRALRRFAKASKATRPFIGFGDPLLEGKPGAQRGIEIGVLFRGAFADLRELRGLPRLPDTAHELRMIAEWLDAGDESVVLGSEMTEGRLRQMELSNRRVLAFATHGVVAGEIEGAAEAALVFTPPEAASTEDDGLLTTSEIARHLKLNADLVILSACNTAAGDIPGAEGLSGLAKAFFYAGSRALLVSHWPVSSQAAVTLTTQMLKVASENPDAGWAEGLRRSMLAMIDDSEREYLAHPLFWAPFVVVGEGGSGSASMR